jgi:hypothetical protein
LKKKVVRTRKEKTKQKMEAGPPAARKDDNSESKGKETADRALRDEPTLATMKLSRRWGTQVLGDLVKYGLSVQRQRQNT